MAREGKEGTPGAHGPSPLELARYDGPPELAEAWNAFVRRFAVPAKQKKGEPAFSRHRIEQANLLNDLTFRERGAAGFLERQGVPATEQMVEVPAIRTEAGIGPTVALRLRALKDEGDRPLLDRLKLNIEDVALALAEATGIEAAGNVQARALFNCVCQRLMEQWIAREESVGLFPPLGLRGDLPGPVRIRRQALLDDVEGELLSGTLYSLQTPILLKAGSDFLWNRLSARAKKRYRQEEVAGDAVPLFQNALFSYDPRHGKQFSGYVIGAVELRAAKGYHPIPPTARRKMARTDSLERIVEQHLKHGRKTNTGELVPDPYAEQPEDAAAGRERDEQLRKALNVLHAREREILSLRFGLDGEEPMSRPEIGVRMGITRERVRQLEARALERLRLFSESVGLTEEQQAELSEPQPDGEASPSSTVDTPEVKENRRGRPGR